MKKVLFVATVVKTHIMEFHIPYLKMLKEEGWETAVAAKNDYENPEECKIPYCDYYFDIPFARSPLKRENIIAYKQLKKIIERGDFDVVHCHTPVGGALARVASMKKRQSGLKVIYTAHGFHFFNGAPVINWIFYYPIEKILAHYTDVLITINKEDYYRAKHKFKAQHIIYIPGIGVNTAKFVCGQEGGGLFRKTLNIAEKDLWLISVGELNKNKNHIAVIKALAEISDKKIFYTVIGAGKSEKWLNDQIAFYRLQDRVHLMGYRTDVDSFYKAADVFIFPSLREGLSLSLMEAMSSSLPILCSRIRGNVDLIDENGGIFFNPQNIESIKNALMQIRTLNIDKRKNMGRYNSKKIKQFDLLITLKLMSGIYKKILEGEW